MVRHRSAPRVLSIPRRPHEPCRFRRARRVWSRSVDRVVVVPAARADVDAVPQAVESPPEAAVLDLRDRADTAHAPAGHREALQVDVADDQAVWATLPPPPSNEAISAIPPMIITRYFAGQNHANPNVPIQDTIGGNTGETLPKVCRRSHLRGRVVPRRKCPSWKGSRRSRPALLE